MENSATLLERVESCEMALTPGPSPDERGEMALTPGPSPDERGEMALTPGSSPAAGEGSDMAAGVWCHETACVEQPSTVGPGTRIGAYSHVMAGATVGSGCQIGRNVVIAPTAVVGDNVVIGHNVVVEDGVVIEDEVVCGPGVVFATIRLPRAVPQLLGSEADAGTVPIFVSAKMGQSPLGPAGQAQTSAVNP